LGLHRRGGATIIATRLAKPRQRANQTVLVEEKKETRWSRRRQGGGKKSLKIEKK